MGVSDMHYTVHTRPLHVRADHKILREIERAKPGAQKSVVTVGKTIANAVETCCVCRSKEKTL